MTSRDGHALEPTPGISYRARAASAFIRAVVKWLPAEARAELSATPDDENAIREWARRWHLDCPCVIEWAKADATARRIVGPGARAGARGFGYDRPDDWLETLNEANGALLDARGVDLRDLSRPRDPSPERSVSPLAADPLMESRGAFLRRAAGHWDARADLARERGYTTISTTPALERDAGWLVRYQLDASVPDLASGASIDAVLKVVGQGSRLRRVLGLSPRRGRGRPRRTRR